MSRKILALTLMTIGLACKAEPTAPPPDITPEKTEVSVEELPNMPTGHPAVDSLNVLSKGPRRLSVEQIERAVETASDLPEGSIQIPPDLALTLGEPDYLVITEESLEPSPLFMKFMVDLAGFVCGGLADSDPDRPVEQRALTRYSNADENIRYILSRWTGIEGDSATPYVTRLNRVYEAGRSGPRGDMSGWEAVCMAVFTSPEFLLY